MPQPRLPIFALRKFLQQRLINAYRARPIFRLLALFRQREPPRQFLLARQNARDAFVVAGLPVQVQRGVEIPFLRGGFGDFQQEGLLFFHCRDLIRIKFQNPVVGVQAGAAVLRLGEG